MQKKNRKGRVVRLVLSGRFVFTLAECETLERRLKLQMNELNGPEYAEDERAQQHNNLMILTAVEGVRRGHAVDFMEPAMLKQVYDAAHSGYGVCKKLGGSEEDARKRAVMCAQIVLEKLLCIAPETDYEMSTDEATLNLLSKVWLGPKGRA